MFFIFVTAHFLKQLPTHIAHIAKAPHATATAKALLKSAVNRREFTSIIENKKLSK